jgi:3-hydroxybutyryl-CoA dehydratase
VFIGDTVTVSYTISEIDTVKRQSKSSIEVRNQNDELVVVGTHILRWVKNPEAAKAAD